MLFIHFLQEKFASSDILCNFAASVPAKPLNDAQMRGAFFIYGQPMLRRYAFQ